MNNNARGTRSTSEKQSYKSSAIGTRHSSISTPNNNIHININLNVKKKSQCIIHGASGGDVGKKINNFIQVTGANKNQVSGEEEKHLQEPVKSTAVGKTKFLMTTNKKSQTDKKIEKTKKKVNKEKEKTASKPFTPEKQQNKSSEEKSKQKSKTGKKLAKQKASKSMENLKIFKEKHSQQDNRRAFDLTVNNKDNNKVKSKSNSNSKQKSREKSATKLKKNRASSKNIVVTFQNSGIKKVLGTQRQTINKNEGLQHFRKSKKSLKVNKHTQKDMMKINEFTQERKKNEQKKKKQSAEHTTKAIRIKDELIRGSKEKREFFSKPERKQGGGQSGKNLRYPIYFGDQEDDNNNEFEDERLMMTNAQKSGINFSTHRTPEKPRVQSVRVSPQIGHITKKPSSTKKLTSKSSLIQKYKHGKLTSSEYTKFITKIVMIQANWRGFFCRKKLLQEIWKMNKMVEERRKLIDQKRREFWDDDENNSITNLEVESEGMRVKKVRDKKIEANSDKILIYKRNYHTPQESNYNSSFTPTDQIDTNNKKYESQSGNQLQQKEQQWTVNNNHNSNSNDNSNENSIDNNTFLMTQIQLLKRQLQEQNQKFTILQKQNTQLKENLMSKKQGEKKKEYNESDGRKGFRKSLQIATDEEELVKKPFDSQFLGNNAVDNKNIIKGIKSPSSIYVQTLKKQLASSSSFQSPSSRSFLKSPQSQQSMYNLQHVFKKKQLSIDMTYEKNSIIYQQMLQNNIVSPKTYNFKRLELDERYKRQKQEISSKFKQAEKVIKYISEEIVVVNEEKDGEDESPKKNGEMVNNVINSREQQQIHHAENTSEQHSQHTPQQQQIYQPGVTRVMENSSTQSNFRKYWTDDTDQVHKKVLQISQRIDQQLLKVEKQQNKDTINENINFYSLDGDNDDNISEDEDDNQGNDEQQQHLHEQSSLLQVNKQQQQQQQQQQQYSIQNIDDEYNSIQPQQLIPNISNHSSTSNTSGRNLDAYNIHYPSSPSSNSSNIMSHNPPPSNQHYKFTVEQDGLIDDDDNQHQHQHQQQQHHSSVDDNDDDDIDYIQTTQSNNNNNNDQQLTQNKSYVSQSMKSSQQSINKLQKGFDTRLTFIKQYCIALCEFIRSEDDLKEKFIENISQSLKYNYYEYLKSYRTTMANSQNDIKYNSTIEDYVYPYFKILHGPIIGKALNAQNTNRFDQLYNQSYAVTKELTQQTIQTRKYFIHAIIDVFNESLDFQRPGSIYGQSLPWLAQSKNLKNNHVKYLKDGNSNQILKLKKQLSNESDNLMNNNSNESSQLNEQKDQDERLDKIFGIAIAKIIQWGSCLCGFIPQPVSFDGDQTQAVNIDEEQTNLVRQTRLAYMLEKSLAQEEERMVDHTMQQLEVQLEIQQRIYYDLVQECANQLLVVSNKRHRMSN